jgi:hypothetical protein
MHREERIEQVGEADPVCLGDKPEERTIAVEAPWLSLDGHGECRLAVAVEQLASQAARGVSIGDLDSDGPDPPVTRPSGTMPAIERAGVISSSVAMLQPIGRRPPGEQPMVQSATINTRP